MKLEYKIMESTNFEKEKLKDFILDVNYDFPIPITTKININEFLDKIKELGKVYCVYEGNKIVGCNYFYANNTKEKIAFITLLAIKKEYRNYGIGSILIDKTIEYCKKIDFKKIQLYTHENNILARKFYSKKNFYEIECDRKYDVKLEIKL